MFLPPYITFHFHGVQLQTFNFPHGVSMLQSSHPVCPAIMIYKNLRAGGPTFTTKALAYLRAAVMTVHATPHVAMHQPLFHWTTDQASVTTTVIVFIIYG